MAIKQQHVIIGDESVKKVTFGNDLPFALICGPCAIESYDLAMSTAETLKNITDKLNIGLVYKSSFDKANRTSIDSNRGVGMDEGLDILAKIRKTFSVPVITDIHNENQVDSVAEVVDALQIPAFLCRQTDLLMKAAKTGKAVNIKKGQFLAPNDMEQVVLKATAFDNKNILLTERGVSFGYHYLISDMRALRIMSNTGFPVIFDATHSVQIPGGNKTKSSGQREFIEPLARAAAAVGVAGFFMESHPNPDEAISDGANMISTGSLEQMLITLRDIELTSKKHQYQDIKNSD